MASFPTLIFCCADHCSTEDLENLFHNSPELSPLMELFYLALWHSALTCWTWIELHLWHSVQQTPLPLASPDLESVSCVHRAAHVIWAPFPVPQPGSSVAIGAVLALPHLSLFSSYFLCDDPTSKNNCSYILSNIFIFFSGQGWRVNPVTMKTEINLKLHLRSFQVQMQLMFSIYFLCASLSSAS